MDREDDRCENSEVFPLGSVAVAEIARSNFGGDRKVTSIRRPQVPSVVTCEETQVQPALTNSRGKLDRPGSE